MTVRQWQKGNEGCATLVELMTVERELAVQWVKTRVDDGKIIELYFNKSLSMQKTADLLGISKGQVLYRLHKLGLQRS